MLENKAQKVGENEEWRNYGLTDREGMGRASVRSQQGLPLEFRTRRTKKLARERKIPIHV